MGMMLEKVRALVAGEMGVRAEDVSALSLHAMVDGELITRREMAPTLNESMMMVGALSVSARIIEADAIKMIRQHDAMRDAA